MNISMMLPANAQVSRMFIQSTLSASLGDLTALQRFVLKSGLSERINARRTTIVLARTS
jgi:hypothetical protein